jgi:hypothetical protein
MITLSRCTRRIIEPDAKMGAPAGAGVSNDRIQPNVSDPGSRCHRRTFDADSSGRRYALRADSPPGYSGFFLRWPVLALVALAVALPVAGRPAITIAEDGDDWLGKGSPTNVVQILNDEDDTRRMKAHTQFNVIWGDDVSPVNIAYAENSCLRCASAAVALQFNVYRRTPSNFAPQNAAASVNADCDGCFAYTKATQATVKVDSEDLIELGRRGMIRLNRDLNDIEQDYRRGRLTHDEMQAQVLAVVERFWQLVYRVESGPGTLESPRRHLDEEKRERR